MELESSTKEQIEKMIGDNEVFLFMKGNPDFPMCCLLYTSPSPRD